MLGENEFRRTELYTHSLQSVVLNHDLIRGKRVSFLKSTDHNSLKKWKFRGTQVENHLSTYLLSSSLTKTGVSSLSLIFEGIYYKIGFKPVSGLRQCCNTVEDFQLKIIVYLWLNSSIVLRLNLQIGQQLTGKKIPAGVSNIKRFVMTAMKYS